MLHNEEELTYFISEKKGILVVSFIGALTRTNGHILEKCMKEILSKDARWVILNFRDVPNHVEKPVFSSLVRMQQMIRSKPAELWISGLHPDLRRNLIDSGLMRVSEITNNLAEALEGVQVSRSQSSSEAA